jgi:hypothetical protein
VKQRDHIVGKSLDTMNNFNENAKKNILDNYLDMANTFRENKE